ncbi:MAG TPA: SGNH/GDSL hydrolase family protein [Acidobacteriaceae bacterium]|nr:SGNH/GDSL hydrolase family protein [Acidobacteriaceae bacterium]
MKIFCCLLLLVPFASAQTNPPVAPSSPTSTPSQTEALPPTPKQIAHMEEMLQDWPDLARYRAANAALPLPAAGENRVVFMGDSITDAWGRSTGIFFPGEPYINRGISGQTTPQMLIRFWPDVIALQPKVVVILAGTNDIAGNTGPSTPEMIQENFMAMADLATANGIRVVLASILPAADYRWRPGIDPKPVIRGLNAWMRAYCAQKGYVYLDYYSAMVNAEQGMKSELTIDGVHPNAAGYAVMSPLAEKAIAEALGTK